MNRTDKFRKKPRHGPLSAWQEQAMTWRAPERAFTCCGTTFRAMTADALLLMRNAHQTTHRGAV